MKTYHEFFTRNWFIFSFIALLFLSLLLRFYNYPNRWGLAYDQAHDALVARYAVQAGKVPLLGPFSSAGPFQTGGEWYWIVMLPVFISSDFVLPSWIFITIMHVIFVGVIMLTAKMIEGKRFALIAGFLATFSTAQIAQSVSLTNQSPISFFAALSIYSATCYISTKRSIFIFLTALFIGCASAIHLQGVALLMLLLSVFLFTAKISWRKIPLMVLGLIIPWLPVLFYDFYHQFFNFNNMIQYYLHDQYKISLDVLGRRWLTYGGVLIPQIWGRIVGGGKVLGYVEIIGIACTFLFANMRKDSKNIWNTLALTTIFMLILIRYTRTPLYDSYFVFMHPFIILLTSYFILRVIRLYFIAGSVLLLVILIGSMSADIPELRGGYNYTPTFANDFANALIEKYPNEKFAIYDNNVAYREKSLSLVLFLDSKKKVDDNGHRIGLTVRQSDGNRNYDPVIGKERETQLFNLNGSSSADLRKDNWVLVSPKTIYNNTEEWSKNK